MANQYDPVTTVEQLNALDSDLCLAGYRAGFGFTEVNYMQKDPAYWHGYRNGQVDRGLEPITPEQCQLAREAIASGMFDGLFAQKH